MRLDGALAVVTGAGSGIGRATALALAGRGARVLAVDLDEGRAEETASACGGWAARLDVTAREAVDAFVATTLERHGTPDVLVNNAGAGMTGRFLDMQLADWDWIVSTNLLGAVQLTRAFGPGLLARRSGHVVNVASGLAYAPRATEPGYVTTKAAVLAWSQCLRADWHAAGVGVSVVCPGVTDTAIVRTNTRYLGGRADPSERARIEAAFARGARPGLVAAAVVDAIERDRSVVPVGRDARAAWLLRRVVPQAAVDRFARWGAS